MSIIRTIAGYIPRSWRIHLLRELAWPEFRVERKWIVSDPTSPAGIKITYIPLAETESAEAWARITMLAARAL